MATAQFIDSAYLRAHTTIESNVDDDKLQPFIVKAQDIRLQHTLGSGFMQHLFSQIINNALTPNEVILINEYIARTVAEWTLYECLPMLNFKLTNKAVSQESSEYSQPSSLSDIKYIRASVRDVAEFYSERLRKYLCDNSELFPEYVNADNENLERDSKTYFSGIFIPNSGSCGC